MKTLYRMSETKSNRSIWSQLGDALKGTEVDYTKIGIRHAIFLLAVPMILELVMESIFALVDIYFVGKLGTNAVASVGLTENYMYLLYAVAMGLSMSVTAIVARRIGEKEKEKAENVAVQAIFIGLIASLPFALAGIFFSKELLAFMNAAPEVIKEGHGFCQWMLGGNMVIMLIFLINGIFRGAGDAAIAMWVLTIANLINIILDPMLIFGIGPFPELGVEGAAIATNIGRGTGVLIQLYLLFKGGKHVRILFSQLRVKWDIVWNIIKTSIGGIGQMLVSMTAWIFLMRILADIGTEAAAAATFVIRLIMFTLMPAWGLSNAAATLVGQNLGAKNPDRAERSVWMIGSYNMVFLIGVSICYFIFGDQLMRVFTNDEAVISIGAEWLRILSYSYFLYGWWMVAVQAFNGAGDTVTPTLINLIFFWGIQIPLAYLLALHLEWTYSGVFWAVLVSESLAGIATLLLFKRGKWKKFTV